MIDKKEVDHVARLARLTYTPEEIELFTHQLNAILNYFEQLKELDTTGIEPTSHAIPLSNVFKGDDVQDSLPVDATLSNAPDKKKDSFRVPKIIE
ncbi:MAG TPA: Asp-tRNA(Asn)/Glu-tRNA(Gln) amidotransferase subunit GatC [Thermodesulfobacteriota bacterium]|nr:Asp-tRNA(Asn)/Glu-tRNA(Gln) amidotransferase subunit GatC [Thermodesulfobacteriota bacterium]